MFEDPSTSQFTIHNTRTALDCVVDSEISTHGRKEWSTPPQWLTPFVILNPTIICCSAA